MNTMRRLSGKDVSFWLAKPIVLECESVAFAGR